MVGIVGASWIVDDATGAIIIIIDKINIFTHIRTDRG